MKWEWLPDCCMFCKGYKIYYRTHPSFILQKCDRNAVRQSNKHLTVTKTVFFTYINTKQGNIFRGMTAIPPALFKRLGESVKGALKLGNAWSCVPAFEVLCTPRHLKSVSSQEVFRRSYTRNLWVDKHLRQSILDFFTWGENCNHFLWDLTCLISSKEPYDGFWRGPSRSGSRQWAGAPSSRDTQATGSACIVQISAAPMINYLSALCLTSHIEEENSAVGLKRRQWLNGKMRKKKGATVSY